MLTKATNAFLDKLDQTTGIKIESKQLNSESKLKIDNEILEIFQNDNSWSDELKLLKIRKNHKILVSEIFNLFKSLRLVNLSIKEIDSHFTSFQNLKELNLSGNMLKQIDNIPTTVEILDLNANRLVEFPDLRKLTKLMHLGIAYNEISCIPTDHIPRQLLSLDASYNRLDDLKSIISSLEPLKSLKHLALMGNILELSSAYRSFVISKLHLTILDDVPVLAITSFKEDDIHNFNIKVSIECVTGLKLPECTPLIHPEQPKDEFKYSVKVEFKSIQFETEYISWSPDIIEFNFSKVITFPISNEIEAVFKNGPVITLLEAKNTFIQSATDTNPTPTNSKNVKDTKDAKNAKDTKTAKDTKDAKKGTAKKPVIEWIASPVETKIIGSKSISILDLLTKKEYVADYLLDGCTIRIVWKVDK